MFRIKIIFAILFSVSLVYAADFSGKSQRFKYNFNSDWKLFVGDANGAEKFDFDDSKWKSVTTPNAWNEDDAFRKDIVDLSTGIAWYRKHFKLPANSSVKKIFLINQTSMTTDDLGNPFIAAYWGEADSKIPQYRIVYFDEEKWNQRQVSQRQTPFTLSGGGTKRIPISRPQIVVDSERIIVIFRDIERQNRISAANCHKRNPSNCRILDLSQTEVGMWEPTLDQQLWKQKKLLHLFIQKVGQGDGERLENLPPQMISILEWKP
jgi:BNR repeat-containing family member